MPLPSPSRRGLAVLATATVGTVAAAATLDRLGHDDEPPTTSPPPADDAAATERGVLALADGGVRLASEPGGVRTADVPLTAVGGAAVSARRSTPRRGLDTGPVETDTFSMLGVTWRGSETTVLVRTRAAATGSWSGWTRLHPMVDGPDRGSGEGDPGLRATEPTWVGAADGLHVRVVGDGASDLRLALIEPESATAQPSRPSVSRSAARGAETGAGALALRTAARRRSALRPRMRSRRAWGADDRLRSGKPTINRTIKQIHVHHTVNSNSYSRGDVPGLIRGMYRYHTRNLGWSDIGYNFLVDRFGRIWVGRYGGPGRAVRGAHTLGFNHASAGVSVIGNFESGRPNRRIVKAVARLAAWKLHRYGRNPRGWTKITSTGSDRYRYGTRIRARTIDGHRDTNQTACPGGYLQARLGWVRRRAARRIVRLT